MCEAVVRKMMVHPLRRRIPTDRSSPNGLGSSFFSCMQEYVSMRKTLAFLCGLAAVALGWLPAAVQAQNTVKIGILHSLSGTMAISETSLRDVVLMAADEINAAGGVKVGGTGYKIEPVV